MTSSPAWRPTRRSCRRWAESRVGPAGYRPVQPRRHRSTPITDTPLVVTDLDGTLTDGVRTIHDDALSALAELDRRRIPVLVATGRRRRSAGTILGDYGRSRPAVLLGGTLGYDFRDGVEFHRRSFTPEAATRILEVFLRHDLEPVVYLDDGEVETTAGPDCASNPLHIEHLQPHTRRVAASEAIDGAQVLQYAVIGNPSEDLYRVAEEIGALGECHVHPDLMYDGLSLMCTPPDVHKWAGVTSFIEREGIAPGLIVAVGDGANDADLLRRADVALVMENGMDEALAEADHLLPPSASGGWARVLDFL